MEVKDGRHAVAGGNHGLAHSVEVGKGVVCREFLVVVGGIGGERAPPIVVANWVALFDGRATDPGLLGCQCWSGCGFQLLAQGRESRDHWVVVADVPVGEDARFVGPRASEVAIVEETNVVHGVSRRPTDCREVALIREDFEGPWPHLCQALGAFKALVEVSHEDDGVRRALSVDVNECPGEAAAYGCAGIMVRHVYAADDDGAS